MISALVRVEYGTDISSRQRAASLRIAVESHVSDSGQVELDFTGVRSISSSFADELFGILVASHGDTWFRDHVRVVGLTPPLRRIVLESVFNRVGEAV
jgi:anti-anti-sigma regulatory factor